MLEIRLAGGKPYKEVNIMNKILEKYNYALFTTDGKKFTFDKSNYPKICDLIAKPLIK